MLYNWMIDSGIWAELSPKAKALYIALLRHVDHDTRCCWPTVDLLSREAGLSERTVSYGLRELERRKLVKTWRRGFKTKSKNLYYIPDHLPVESIQDHLPVGKRQVSIEPCAAGVEIQQVPSVEIQQVSPVEIRQPKVLKNNTQEGTHSPAPAPAGRGQPARGADQPQPVDPEEIHRYMREQAPWTHRQDQERVAREVPETVDSVAMKDGGI
jgi:DNA-binding transcriptional ArsR family regulator